eukprot:SAG31_NODE_10749_length_1102_cov_1.458624_2_plen_46_part_01
MRLVAATLGSSLILGEPVSGLIEWLGLCVVLATGIGFALYERSYAN